MVETFEDDATKDPYHSFREKLNEAHDFPSDYLFKFIFPNDKAKLTEIYQIFDNTQNSISTKESKNGKYISASIQAFVLDANQVINLYKEVHKIEGVIML
ncbi:DUF493 domain-containing protein [Riemerella anatipestifer]|uniref:DUF493 domain-containing protein n=2 Tax=Riemerella anatipestifer TaxID=34085 RepID=J9R3P6_RIEAN|nr:DUF493 domain-containing protein [Riemerella anatipestifer]AFR36499.1 hypothetical protein B739_1916 [Riemerella anatipestifer RA-CH-1]AIH01295.1 hypothetical protein M949_0124 [Riemerella anatipestifer CH3]AQY23027.1 hypothetical protein AB406_2087 [Riemerella anatipestifer]AZZ57702.1 DUF493 domain-containing protein [Riemerella anatipestifer]MBO4233051.1 DUF493 domain-containing protein [Riemerella anatipestifer]